MCVFVRVCIDVVGLRMCPESMTPFYLSFSGLLGGDEWGKRDRRCHYYHLPWRLIRPHIRAAEGPGSLARPVQRGRNASLALQRACWPARHHYPAFSVLLDRYLTRHSHE